MKEIKQSGWGIIVDKNNARYELIMRSTRGPKGSPAYLKPGSSEYKKFNKNVGKIYDHKDKKIITKEEFEKRTKLIGDRI